MTTTTTPRTAARRAGKARAAHLAPFQAMSDRELIRAYQQGLGRDQQAAYTVILERVGARGIVVDYDRADDAIEATVLSFEAGADG